MENTSTGWYARITENTPGRFLAFVVREDKYGTQVDRVFGSRYYSSRKSAERFTKKYIEKNR